MIILAGVVFHQRNPRQEPARDETKIAKSRDKKELFINAK